MKSSTITAIAMVLALSTPALATMPLLTPEPKPPSVAACRAWAVTQDEEAIDMWGRLESGKSSRRLGIKRLAGSCMGHRPPEITGLGSSAGFDESYCNEHRRIKACKGGVMHLN